ncbi:hypothetical protein V6N12_007698 [Hibiscus sabdariffa]|uniref:Uncharacterized protein n=1 Tax=Hibiscus sabdariffa TaxID=183260 RepID=A0ABR2F2I8_9ROSI
MTCSSGGGSVVTTLVCWRKSMSPGRMVKGKFVFSSLVVAGRRVIIAADFLVVHDISCLLFTLLERVSGQATLSWFMWTNGEMTECSSYHFLEVDLQSQGNITFSRLLQGVKTYLDFLLFEIKGNLLNVGPSINFCKMFSTSLKMSGFTNVILPFWSFCMQALCKCAGAATILVYGVYQGNQKCKAYRGPHAINAVQAFTSFEIVKGF